MADLQTRMVGFAPDARGRDRPLEIVYVPVAPPSFWARLYALSPARKLELGAGVLMLGLLSTAMGYAWLSSDARAPLITLATVAYMALVWWSDLRPGRKQR